MNELGENVLQKLSEEEKTNLESLVRDAIGFKQERGDSITISSGEFIDDIELSVFLGMKILQLENYLGKLFTILVLAIVTFGALRPLLNRILVPVGGNRC